MCSDRDTSHNAARENRVTDLTRAPIARFPRRYPLSLTESGALACTALLGLSSVSCCRTRIADRLGAQTASYMMLVPLYNCTSCLSSASSMSLLWAQQPMRHPRDTQERLLPNQTKPAIAACNAASQGTCSKQRQQRRKQLQQQHQRSFCPCRYSQASTSGRSNLQPTSNSPSQASPMHACNPSTSLQ